MYHHQFVFVMAHHNAYWRIITLSQICDHVNLSDI